MSGVRALRRLPAAASRLRGPAPGEGGAGAGGVPPLCRHRRAGTAAQADAGHGRSVALPEQSPTAARRRTGRPHRRRTIRGPVPPLVDITGCTIQHDRINQTVEEVKAILERLHIAPYDVKRRSGVVRTIIVRTGFQSDDLQLTLVTGTETLPKSDQLVSELLRKVPGLTTIAHNINTRKTSLVFGDKTRILWGKPTMEDSLGDLKFSLSPRAFFQLNPQQTLKLYEAVRVAAALSGRERVVDAYCGTGTIALWLAPYAAEVRGIEIIPEAVDNARQNAERSGRTNAAFYAGEAEALLPRWVKDGYRPDVIVVDPPRTGCDERLLRAILAAKPKRLVYVSCNPSTLAKDCKVLLAGGYELASVQPVDMFPQTAHVESVCLLVKGDTA
ncbi:23S rRNA (uracil(1939)-C(5))-methyltransferase RlmD [Paenibacillus thiaminolyticus]|uniref:23S rRNA (uracil(1939)-C(5))-methyltransferase RlmD n=1 Tax=Paenibacillus thiaminolyticus TaxID=49283 RepID=UPI003B9835B4